MNTYEKQANDFLKATGTTFKVIGYNGKCEDTWSGCNSWKVELSRNGKKWVFDFKMGSAYEMKMPTAYMVLSCITKYDVGSFEEFCNDFGYDYLDYDTCEINEGSKNIYDAVVNEYKAVLDMFSDCLDDLCEIA